MAYVNNTIDIYKAKFYQYETFFNNFDNISKEQINNYKNNLNDIKTLINTVYNYKKYTNNHSFYEATLKYLSSKEFRSSNTFDHMIIILILCVDPNLEALSILNNSELVSKKQIDSCNAEEKERLSRLKEEQSKEIRQEITSKFGFFDSKLLKYEKLYYNKFVKNVFGVSNNDTYLNNLLKMANAVNSFDSIDDDRIEELKSIAKYYKEETNNLSMRDVAYNILTKNKVLGLKNVKEQLFMLILICDEELNILSSNTCDNAKLLKIKELFKSRTTSTKLVKGTK